MEIEQRKHRLHRSRTLSCFHNVYSDMTVIRRLGEGRANPRILSAFRTLKRARSCITIPLIYTGVASSASSSSLTNRNRSTETEDSLPLLTLPVPDASQPPSPIDPFIRGVTRSSLFYEAILALVLSINIRELVTNGADAIVKALVKKTITLTIALLLAVLLDCAAPAMPMLSIDAPLEVEIRGAAGVVSGWLGQQAGDPLGWKLEERIAEWLWPKPPRIENNPESKKHPIPVDVDASLHTNVVA